MNKDLYSVLKIPKFSSKENIKRSYKSLVMIHHPDLGGNADVFTEITKAYDTLSNEKSRKEYDIKLRNKLNSRKRIRTLRKIDEETEYAANANGLKEYVSKYEDYMLMHKVHLDKNVSTNNSVQFLLVNLALGTGGMIFVPVLTIPASLFLLDSVCRIVKFWTKNPLKETGLVDLTYRSLKRLTDRIDERIL